VVSSHFDGRVMNTIVDVCGLFLLPKRGFSVQFRFLAGFSAECGKHFFHTSHMFASQEYWIEKFSVMHISFLWSGSITVVTVA
jgi:hypothetical protein